MDYRTLVYLVLLFCSIDTLPYERDSDESGDFKVHTEDDDKHIFLDEQEQQKILDLEKYIKDEDKEIFLDEQQKQKTLDFEKNTEDEDKEIFYNEQQEQKTFDFEKNIEDEDREIFLDEQKKQEKLELEKNIVTDKPKPAKYAVTEFIIDVPDDRTKGPIIANFSISKPINIASTTVSTTKFEDKDSSNEEDKNTTSSGNDVNEVVDTEEKENGTGKKNYISILHVKAEYDDKTDKTNKNKIESSDFDFGNVPHVSGIKEYFNGIKQGIVNGFNSIIHKNKNNDESHTHDEATGPFNFFNKIHKKSTDFAQKIHNHIFGDQTEDQF